MNCLPIVSRELGVAARKRSTFWLRLSVAATGLLVGSGCLLLSQINRATTTQMGSILFNVLVWLGLTGSLAAGLFLTSDCLSEEKRDGTLGLLFLTELRSYEVVVGKLLSTSLRGFYALLAVLPILAITQLMGGVTGVQYWKSALALVNGLLCSLAAGMLVSAVSRDSQKALGGTLLVLLLLALGGPAADAAIAETTHRAFVPLWSLSSPAYALASASAWGASAYWQALLFSLLLGCLMFGLACTLVGHTWQEKKGAGARVSRGWACAWKYGGARRRQRLRRKLMGPEPLTWLACRERWQSLLLWAVALLVAGGFVAVLLWNPARETWMVWNYLAGVFILLLYLWVASQACRFFVEARRSGLLELLLASPTSPAQIIAGQWRGWLRMFGLPLLLPLGVHATGAALSQLAFQRLATQAAATTTTAAGTNQTSSVTTHVTVVGSPVTVSTTAGTNSVWSGLQLGSSSQPAAMAGGAALAAALSTTANLLALCWFGMWMGMTSKSANQATLKTILFVQVLPWFVISFGTSMVLGLVMAGLFFRPGSAGPGAWFVWWPLLTAVLSAGVAVAKDIGFILWSRKKLRSCLLEHAAGGLAPALVIVPPPLPQAAARSTALTAPW